MATSKSAADGKATAAGKTTASKAGKTPSSKPKAAPAVRPAASRQATAPKAGSRRSVPARQVDAERRRHYVEVAAYFIAERQGFPGGCDAEHWRAAEAEIDRLIADGKLSA